MLICLFNYVKFFTLKINEDKSFKQFKREKREQDGNWRRERDKVEG